MSGRDKRPTRHHEPASRSARRAHDPSEIYSKHFSLSLRYLHMLGDFSWGAVATEDMFAILERLKQLESLTWREIIVDQKKQNHAIEFEKLCRPAQEHLKTLNELDISEVFSIRVQKKFRIWGIRVGAVLMLLWYDPEHQIYPMNIANN